MSEVQELRAACGGTVVSNPAILGGAPIFCGTRLPVQTLFDYMADGLSLEYYLETFDSTARAQAETVLRQGRESILAELAG